MSQYVLTNEDGIYGEVVERTVFGVRVYSEIDEGVVSLKKDTYHYVPKPRHFNVIRGEALGGGIVKLHWTIGDAVSHDDICSRDYNRLLSGAFDAPLLQWKRVRDIFHRGMCVEYPR